MRHLCIKDVLLSSLILLTLSGLSCPAQTILTDRPAARPLPSPDKEDSFTFAIIADVTDAGPNNLDVLKQAVADLNLLSPDLVLTIGDMIQGYCDRPTWLEQWNVSKQILDGLQRPWYPVAGNHDIYWASNQPKPKEQHEPDYERHIGPLWYAFRHKGCWFIVLYTDEGDPNTGAKSISDPNAQRFSQRQIRWLRSILAKARDAKHIFVFMHHPRWVTEEYGQQWSTIHDILAKARVSAVFAGHDHILRFDGNRDGIMYYRLGTAGGAINRRIEPEAFHHFFLVTVRGRQFRVSAVKIGSVYDPQDPAFARYTLLPITQWRIGQDRIVDLVIHIPQIQPGLRPILQVGLT
ncbi:MAG: metallophosphoesterase, partial [Sedimentisphaerales bacterium]|nr:metallophosphoesterase [Sedimentisphaerales bacterium]